MGKRPFRAHTAAQAQALVWELSHSELRNQAPCISWFSFPLEMPHRCFHIWVQIGGDTEKEHWFGTNGYIPMPVACCSGKERGGSRVHTALVLLGYINYPSLGEVILNDLTVLWSMWERSKIFHWKQSNLCPGLFIKLVNSLALKIMALLSDSSVYCP